MNRYLILLILVMFGCGDAKQKEIEKKKDEVLYLHDEVMPLTDQLYKIRINLQKKINEDTTQEYLEIKEAIVILKNGEDAMMDWMHNFDLSYEAKSADDTYSYFVEQKKSIEAVNLQMKEAMKLGEEILAKQ